MLQWTENGRDIEAWGARGHYQIVRAPGAFTGCVLKATGHDGLPSLALPAFGKHFDTLWKAKDYANRLERIKSTEPLGGVG